MLDLQPKAIFAEGTDSNGKELYRVIFLDGSGREVQHIFTVETIDGMGGLEYTNDFWKATAWDPLVPELTRAVLHFHEARKPVLVEQE